MTALTYSWQCGGDGHTPCPDDAHGTGPKSNREAERHVRRTGHATTTHTTPGDAA